MNHYPITGIPVKEGDPVPIRPNIIDWYAQRSDESIKKQIDLFLLALRRFQQMDPLERLSYFQVAGIHGLPAIPWDENIFLDVKPLQPSRGYCTHNSFLFPVWHRVYVTLYEQRLYECMLEVAVLYEQGEQEEYIKAARTWRLPYWDWALSNAVPELVQLQQVEVVGPYGPEKFPNPLNQYTLPNGNVFGALGIDFRSPSWDPTQGQPFNISRATSRWAPKFPAAGTTTAPEEPTESQIEAWYRGYVDNAQVEQAIQDNEDFVIPGLSVRLWVWWILIITNDWYQFASTRRDDRYNPPYEDLDKISLEGIHNSLHGYIGGIGNMSIVPIAAFDPIFWLHHCFIDKLFAQWQYLRPDKFYDRDVYDPGNFANMPRDVNAESELHPFRDGRGELYTPNKVRNWESLGYGYNLDSWLGVFIKYGITWGLFIKPESKDFVKYIEQGSTRQVQHYEYLVNVRYSRYDLDNGEPYYIHVFLGDRQEVAQLDFKDPLSTWLAAPQRVGSIYTFSNKSEVCANCKTQQDNEELCTEQIPLTHRLPKLFEHAKKRAQDSRERPLPSTGIESSGLPNLGNLEDLLRTDLGSLDSSDTLKPSTQIYLFHSYLFWTATTLDGTPIPPDELPSLEISVSVGITSHEIPSDSTAGTQVSKPSKYKRLLKLPTARGRKTADQVPYTGDADNAWLTPFRPGLSDDLQKQIKDLDLLAAQYQQSGQQHVYR